MNSIMNEYGVIGSLLIDSSLFPEAAGLPDQAFSSPALQEVFRTIRRQYEGRGGFDALTVSVEARRNCPEVTDELLAQMMDITPTTANLDAYIAAVKEEFLARSLREIGAGLMEAEQAPLEALGRVQDALQRLTEENTRGDTDTLTDALVRLGNRVAEQVNGKAPCVPSGLMSFDKLLGGGFINGGLHIIGARPAVGKSALALQIALNAARNGVKVLYLSLEMSAEDCSARLVGNIGGLSSARLMFGGRLTDNEYTRFAKGTTALSALPFVFNQRSGMNVGQVEALAYREKPTSRQNVPTSGSSTSRFQKFSVTPVTARPPAIKPIARQKGESLTSGVSTSGAESAPAISCAGVRASDGSFCARASAGGSGGGVCGRSEKTWSVMRSPP